MLGFATTAATRWTLTSGGPPCTPDGCEAPKSRSSSQVATVKFAIVNAFCAAAPLGTHVPGKVLLRISSDRSVAASHNDPLGRSKPPVPDGSALRSPSASNSLRTVTSPGGSWLMRRDMALNAGRYFRSSGQMQMWGVDAVHSGVRGGFLAV
jgi:hypothetical protein